jgi:fluoride exporter
MQEFLAIVLGSALGGVARYWVSGVVGRSVGETFPWGTLAVNVSGALVIGIVAALAVAPHMHSPPAALWPFTVIGFLGSYTTVSSFSLQTLMLLREAERWRAVANVVLSVSLCVGAAAAGFAVGTALSLARGAS